MTAPKNASSLPLPSGGLAATLQHVSGAAASAPASSPSGAARRAPNLSVLSPSGDGDIRKLMAQATVKAQNPQSSEVDLSDGDLDGVTIRLKYAEVLFNPHQPRLFVNESYESIRTAMKANGMDVALQVTRRGPGEPYMLAGGGNTRLGIAQDIFKQDKDARFEYGHFIFKKWSGERRLKAAAMAENLARSDLKFWEVAKGVCEVIADLEQEHGSLSERRLEELLPLEGIEAKRALIGRWLFTFKRLAGLGSALSQLTGQQVLAKFQPRLNALCRLAVKFNWEVEVYWREVVTPTLKTAGEHFQQAQQYDPEHICNAVEVAFADRVEESAASIKRMLQVMEATQSNVTLADLRTPAPPQGSGTPSTSRAPSAPGAGGHTDGSGLLGGAGASADGRDQDQKAHHHHVGSGQGATIDLEGEQAGIRPEATRSLRGEGVSDLVTQQRTDAAGEGVRVLTPGSQPGMVPGTADADVRVLLQHELACLVESVGVQSCFVPSADLPYGYFMEYPAEDELRISHDGQDMMVRAQASAVYWTLLKLSGQVDPNYASVLPLQSRYRQSLVSDEFSMAFLAHTVIGEAPAVDDILLLATQPGCKAMSHLLHVVSLMQAVNERYPDISSRGGGSF